MHHYGNGLVEGIVKRVGLMRILRSYFLVRADPPAYLRHVLNDGIGEPPLMALEEIDKILALRV